jgi:hypothetical protein
VSAVSRQQARNELTGGGCGQDIFDVDPLRGIVSRIAGDAKVIAFAAVASLL